MKMNTNLYVRM